MFKFKDIRAIAFRKINKSYC